MNEARVMSSGLGSVDIKMPLKVVDSLFVIKNFDRQHEAATSSTNTRRTRKDGCYILAALFIHVFQNFICQSVSKIVVHSRRL